MENLTELHCLMDDFCKDFEPKMHEFLLTNGLVTDHAKLIRYFIRTQYNGVLASQIRHDLLIQVIYELKCDVTGSGWA
ncbi:MAG TPA: hypothetical protein ACHBY7_15965, partial [Arsenophonus sp.]